MSRRRFHEPADHAPFAFTQATEDQIAWWERKYPSDRRWSAVIPALWVAQKQNGGWLSEPAMRAVADRLGMNYIRVYEVATFYAHFDVVKEGGAVAASGLAASPDLPTTVLPFILRGICLLGINSVHLRRELRTTVLDLLVQQADPSFLDSITRTVALADAQDAAGQLLEGMGTGRIVVDVRG